MSWFKKYLPLLTIALIALIGGVVAWGAYASPQKASPAEQEQMHQYIEKCHELGGRVSVNSYVQFFADNYIRGVKCTIYYPIERDINK